MPSIFPSTDQIEGFSFTERIPATPANLALIRSTPEGRAASGPNFNPGATLGPLIERIQGGADGEQFFISNLFAPVVGRRSFSTFGEALAAVSANFSPSGSGPNLSGSTVNRDEGSNVGLRGSEFRTNEQLRREAELAKQLGVDRLSDVKPPSAPELVEMQKAGLTAGEDEFLTATGKLLGETPEAALTTAAPAQQVTEAPTLAAPQGTAATVAGQEAQATGVTQAAPTRVIDPDAIEGVVTEQSLAAAQTEELDERATLTFQLEKLFEGFRPGETPPDWATAPIRRASNIMAARGLGASSIAAAAIAQSVVEAGIPLAREDAQRFATIQLQNLSNKQQTALANAAVFAAMDQTNVGVRLQTQIQNAQNFLAIDVKNLDNLQQAEVLNQAATNQFLLSDQAAENAMEQLNVTTEAETDQFFSQLGVAVDTSNADRITAVEQFNAGQANTISVFNAKQKDLRERFNSELVTQIEASNAQHRRRITLTDNANQMLVNEFNARQANDISVREYNQQYLNYRDAATRIFSSSESNENRAVQLATAELSASATRAAASAGGGGGSSSILPSLISAGGSIVAAVF